MEITRVGRLIRKHVDPERCDKKAAVGTEDPVLDYVRYEQLQR